MPLINVLVLVSCFALGEILSPTCNIYVPLDILIRSYTYNETICLIQTYKLKDNMFWTAHVIPPCFMGRTSVF